MNAAKNEPSKMAKELKDAKSSRTARRAACLTRLSRSLLSESDKPFDVKY